MSEQGEKCSKSEMEKVLVRVRWGLIALGLACVVPQAVTSVVGLVRGYSCQGY